MVRWNGEVLPDQDGIHGANSSRFGARQYRASRSLISAMTNYCEAEGLDHISICDQYRTKFKKETSSGRPRENSHDEKGGDRFLH